MAAEQIAQMNYMVDVEGESANDVAKEFLKSEGLIK